MRLYAQSGWSISIFCWFQSIVKERRDGLVGWGVVLERWWGDARVAWVCFDLIRCHGPWGEWMGGVNLGACLALGKCT